MRRVEQIMGMPISIDIPEAKMGMVFEAAFERLRQIDGKFSTYKPDSEASRFSRGELKESALSQELRFVIKECRTAEKWTDGYFSAWAAGAFDPSGFVKGWAIAEAGRIIEHQGFGIYCIGAGGDILARSDSDKTWYIGIQDPKDKTKILNKLSISSGAVATSGSYERGAHIINPKTGKPADELLSVTVTGPDIITADILATALFAAGESKNPDFMKRQNDYRALIISRSRGSSR